MLFLNKSKFIPSILNIYELRLFVFTVYFTSLVLIFWLENASDDSVFSRPPIMTCLSFSPQLRSGRYTPSWFSASMPLKASFLFLAWTLKSNGKNLVAVFKACSCTFYTCHSIIKSINFSNLLADFYILFSALS